MSENAPQPATAVTCEASDAVRDGMRSVISRDIETNIIAIDYLDGDEWVLTDYRTTVASGQPGCWHVASESRLAEVSA